MADNKAGTLGTISWYLIAGGGNASARVYPGTSVGEDDAGALSLRREHGLLDLDVDDGRLRLSLTSRRHEILRPGRQDLEPLIVQPQMQVSVRLPNNLLAFRTSFATQQPNADVVELEVVESRANGSSVRTASPYGEARADASALVGAPEVPVRFEVLNPETEPSAPVSDRASPREAGPAGVAQRGVMRLLGRWPLPDVTDTIPASLVFLGAAAAGFLLLFLS
jgi:hypothetical protein